MQYMVRFQYFRYPAYTKRGNEKETGCYANTVLHTETSGLDEYRHSQICLM